MRILLDHCVPKPFRRELPSHSVITTAEMGWEDLRNGKLLATAAANRFDVIITVDKKMKREQNLSTLPVSVIVLDAIKNTPDVLRPFAPFVERVLPTLKTGTMLEISSTGVVTVIASGR